MILDKDPHLNQTDRVLSCNPSTVGVQDWQLRCCSRYLQVPVNEQEKHTKQSSRKLESGLSSYPSDSSECTGSILFKFLRGDTDEIENCPNV